MATALLRVARHDAAVCAVRVSRPDSACVAHLGRLFACEWPTSVGAGSGTVLCLSPIEWAIIGVDPATALAQVSAACGDALFDVQDMSAAYVVYEVAGDESRSFLAKSCSLDLHARSFLAGRCAQTLFAQVAALIVRSGPASLFAVYVEAALTYYLDAWFRDAAAEYA